MKMKTVLLLLIGTLSLATVSPTFAITSAAITSTTTITQQNANLKNEFKMQKKASKFQRLLEKRGIDLQDPVQKWLWYGIGFIGLAVILTILGVLPVLYGLLALAGVVCLVVWFVKKGGA